MKEKTCWNELTYIYKNTASNQFFQVKYMTGVSYLIVSSPPPQKKNVVGLL